MGDARGLSATAAARPASRLHPRRRRRGCRDRVSARRGGDAGCGPPASAGAAEQLHPGRGDRGLLRRRDQHPYQPDPGGGARRARHDRCRFDGGPASTARHRGSSRARLDGQGHRSRHPACGHQVAHLTGWTDELGDALLEELSPQSPEVAELWRSWRSEIAADIHAFVLAGWAPVPALANVVDGTTPAVHRIRAGDPHPPGWLRVMLNVALCRRWFGAGPWDALAEAWQQRHDPGRHSFAGARVAAASLPLLPRVVAVCTDWPFAAFKGRPIHALADPRRVAPPELAALAQRAGTSLLASRYLARRESLRILACLTASQPAEPAVQAAAVARLHKWLATLAPNPLPRAA